MPKPMRVIEGPARCGKSRRVIAMFVESLKDSRRPVIIVPDAASAAAMRRRLLAELPVLATGDVSTFVALAEHVLAEFGPPAHLIGSHDRELLLRAVVHELAEAGRLSYFLRASAHDGFYPQLASFIRELKSCQIKPSDFRASTSGPANTEIALIYERYQDFLEKSSLYDAEGRFWQARLVLDGPGIETPLYDDVYIDGFTDFTPNELSLLKALSRHVSRLFVTLPNDSRRHELFAKTSRTVVGFLKRDYEVEFDEMPAAPADSVSHVLAGSLFSPEPPAPRFPSGAALNLISTAGARMELDEIAREAKRLIAAGRAPREIALVVRSVPACVDAASDAFRRAGVPLDVPASLDFARTPLHALLASLVDLAEKDFERDTVMGVLLSPYVDLATVAAAIPPGDVRRLVRAAGIVKGYPQWGKRLASLEFLASRSRERDPDAEPDDAPSVEVSQADVPLIASLAGAVRRLEEVTVPFAKPAPAVVLADRFAEALDALGVRKRILEASIPEDVLFHDLAAWAALTEALESIRRSPHRHAPISARAFLALLALVAGEGKSSGDPDTPGVAFLDVATARNLSFPVVFLAGVLADAYPSPPPISPLHTRGERRKLANLGLVTRTEETHLDSERLLFYQAVTRAEDALYITWPATDEAGKPKLPAFYVDDVRALFDLDPSREIRYGPARAFVPLDDAASLREVASAAVRDVARADSAQKVKSLAALASAAGLDCRRVLRSAAIEARRESVDDYDSFEARLGPEAASAVSTRFPHGTAWSGSSLGDYRRCPFVFFLKRVLGAERPVGADVVPAPVDRGSFAHDFLARFFSSVVGRGKLAALLEGDEALLDESFAEVFDQVAASRGTLSNLAGDPFWEIETDRLRSMLFDFVESEIKRLASAKVAYRPAFFELAFGPSKHADGRVPATAPLVFVERDKRRESLCGRIDRVDVLEDGEGGHIAVVDYKLSRKPTSGEVKSLVDVQMALYLFAAPRVIRSDRPLEPLDGFYRVIRSLEGVRPVMRFEGDEDRQSFFARFADVVFLCADSIRNGVFSPVPAVKCPDFCPGRGVCRLNEARIELFEREVEADET